MEGIPFDEEDRQPISCRSATKHNPATIVVQRDDGSTACISRERLVFVAAAGDLKSHIGRLGVKFPPFRRRLTTSRASADHGATCFCEVLLFWAALIRAASTAGAAISTANAAGTKPGMDSETLCWFSSTWRDGG